MKNVFLVTVLFMCSLRAWAFSFQDQLEARNSNWRSHSSLLNAGEARFFQDDRSFIQAHFAAVELVLLHADVSGLNAVQLKARKRNIEVLHDYAARGIFPANHCTYYTPVFIDEFNTHCAVGHLMQMSGHEDLAVRISTRNNYVYAANIDDPEMLSWQMASGLSLQELALIQPTYEFLRAEPEPSEAVFACTTAYFDAEKKYVQYSGTCLNGQLNGAWTQYITANRLWVTGSFVNGKKNGTWTYYFTMTAEANKIRKQETWSDGKKNGSYKEFDQNGSLVTEGSYVNNERSGVWKSWNNGTLMSEAHYKKNYLHGTKIIYYYGVVSRDTKVHILEEYDLGNLISRKTYDANGQLSDSLRMKFSKEELYITNRVYYSSVSGRDSSISECPQPGLYVGGCITETWSYDKDGNYFRHMKTRADNTLDFQFNYKDGSLTYAYVMYPGGTYAERWFADSTQTGLTQYRSYDQKGRIIIQGACSASDTTLRTGVWEFRNSTGETTAKGYYVNGVKEGVWIETYSDGKIYSGNYLNGNKIGEWKEWNGA